MTTARENDILTQVGPGTPMGELMRQYWLPAAKSSELEADDAPMRLMLLGEKLIAFRDSAGRVGVMDHRCPHRCASLFYGRNEAGGLTCVYHGWKFDTEGKCLDMANVPPHQDFKDKVKAKAYRTVERNGMIWVYMGAKEDAPPLPEIEATLVPEDQMGTDFILRECNWLQAVEGELDTSHLGVLHFGSVGREAFHKDEQNKFVVADRAPQYIAEETRSGYMYGAYRPGDEGKTYWRIGQFMFPFWALPPIYPMERNILARIYVPLDDTHTMLIAMVKNDADTRDRGDIAKRIPGATMTHDYIPHTTDWLGRWRLRQNGRNDYEIDREVQRSQSFSGIDGIILQDQMVTESMGAVEDRTFEHLAPSDVMITRTRRHILRAATEFARTGEPPPSAVDPAAYAGVRGGFFQADEGIDWKTAYEDEIRRAPLKVVGSEAAE